MKALSVNSGFAALIGAGEKTIEVRTWNTAHRGEILICANKEKCSGTISGHAICIVRIVDVRPLKRGDCDAACMPTSDFQPGLFAWVLENVCSVIPFPVRGMPGIFDVDDSLINRIREEEMTDSEIDALIEEKFMPLITA